MHQGNVNCTCCLVLLLQKFKNILDSVHPHWHLSRQGREEAPVQMLQSICGGFQQGYQGLAMLSAIGYQLSAVSVQLGDEIAIRLGGPEADSSQVQRRANGRQRTRNELSAVSYRLSAFGSQRSAIGCRLDCRVKPDNDNEGKYEIASSA